MSRSKKSAKSKEPSDAIISVYAVRSQDGKWFRAKGIDGYGDSWVEDLHRARIYTRPGPAKSQITWWSRNYPDYGVPDLIQFVATRMVVISQDERVKDRNRKAAERQAMYQQQAADMQLERAKQELEEAQNNWKSLQSKIKKGQL